MNSRVDARVDVDGYIDGNLKVDSYMDRNLGLLFCITLKQVRQKTLLLITLHVIYLAICDH